MQKPTFSVILPTYNRCHILWRAIQSVLAQTYPWFELIIVNDASTDETEKLVKLFTDPRIVYIRLNSPRFARVEAGKNSGPSHARNLGLKKAQGEYIAYIDSDNEWHKDYLQVYFDAFKKYPAKLVLFCKKNYRLHIIEPDKKSKKVRDEFTGHRKYFDLKRLWQRKIIIDTNVLCHRKEVTDEVGGWDEKLNFWEDYELTLRISRKFPKAFMYINRAMVDYEQTLDFSKAQKAIKEWEEAEKYIFQKHKDHPLIKNQKWYPKEAFKSTGSVIKFLESKKPKY